MPRPTPTQREREKREPHPGPARLARFVRGELAGAEAGAVVRHLLRGCPHCLVITRPLWAAVDRLAAAPLAATLTQRTGGRTMSEPTPTLTGRAEPAPPADMPAAAAPANAFTPEFLALIADRDEALTAAVADFCGPWKVEPTPLGFAVFRQWESREERHAPEGIFRHRETALLVCSAFPAIGHEPYYRQDEEQSGFGFPVEAIFGDRGWQPMGALRWWNEDLIRALNVVESVVRSPAALAALLQAAGPLAVRRVGEILAQGAAE